MKPGTYWVVNVCPGDPRPVFWVGAVYVDGRQILTDDVGLAARFDSEESLRFQATMLALPPGWAAERQTWL